MLRVPKKPMSRGPPACIATNSCTGAQASAPAVVAAAVAAVERRETQGTHREVCQVRHAHAAARVAATLRDCGAACDRPPLRRQLAVVRAADIARQTIRRRTVRTAGGGKGSVTRRGQTLLVPPAAAQAELRNAC